MSCRGKHEGTQPRTWRMVLSAADKQALSTNNDVTGDNYAVESTMS